MLKRIARNPLIDLLVHLKGNERACLWTEPLWGIPYNLYVPFVSVYMAALGMTPVQIGAMSTIFFISQMFHLFVIFCYDLILFSVMEHIADERVGKYSDPCHCHDHDTGDGKNGCSCSACLRKVKSLAVNNIQRDFCRCAVYIQFIICHGNSITIYCCGRFPCLSGGPGTSARSHRIPRLQRQVSSRQSPV